MDFVLNIAAAIAAGAATIFVGYRVGVALRPHPSWLYWVANAVVIVLGTVVITLGYGASLDAVKWAGLAVIAGGLTGLKYGLARVVGQWRAADLHEEPVEERAAWRPSGKSPTEPR